MTKYGSITPKREKEVKRNEEKKLQELRAKSKPLEELIIREKFTVSSVLQTAYSHRVIVEEPCIGGSNASENTGQSYKTTLEVVPEGQNIPVKKIIFYSQSSVRKGDRITALIPRFSTEKPFTLYAERPRHPFLLDRPYKEEEIAGELSILNLAGETVRKEVIAGFNDKIKIEDDES